MAGTRQAAVVNGSVVERGAALHDLWQERLLRELLSRRRTTPREIFAILQGWVLTNLQQIPCGCLDPTTCGRLEAGVERELADEVAREWIGRLTSVKGDLEAIEEAGQRAAGRVALEVLRRLLARGRVEQGWVLREVASAAETFQVFPQEADVFIEKLFGEKVDLGSAVVAGWVS